jgi:hypothetical protein
MHRVAAMGREGSEREVRAQSEPRDQAAEALERRRLPPVLETADRGLRDAGTAREGALADAALDPRVPQKVTQPAIVLSRSHT